jgi:drug/metabolite transporter (DMT)-like permease
MLNNFKTLLFLIFATGIETFGDSLIRAGVREHVGLARAGLLAAGAVLLFGYGFTLSLAPSDFGRLIGLYVATFFVMGQLMNYLVFKTPPTLPILVGGALILAGGILITLWAPKGCGPIHAEIGPHHLFVRGVGGGKNG